MSERKAGRPPLKDDSEKQDKKVMLSFTQTRYDELKKMQVLLNQATLTATILFFMDRGMQNVREEFANVR